MRWNLEHRYRHTAMDSHWIDFPNCPLRTHLKRFPLLLALLLLKHFGRCGDETTEYSTYFIESSLRRPSSIDQILCTSIVEHRFRFYKRHMLRCISEHTIIGTQRIQVHKGSLACCRENIDRIKNRKGKIKYPSLHHTLVYFTLLSVVHCWM